MSKLFGDRPVSTLALVEAPVSRSYAHKARVAFFTAGPLCGLLAAAALSASMAAPLAVLAGALVGLAVGFTVAVLVFVWPVLRVLWWWAAELTVVAVVWGSSAWLASATASWFALAVLGVFAAAVGLVRPVRRWVVAWSWCAIVRHRLRLCFAQFVRAVGPRQAGSLPLLLWARPTPAGERVWVWLRPGLDLTDLEGKTAKVAVACWAGEVRVVRASARYAALIRVDVTRRDPLTGKVPSPLVALFADPPDADDRPVPVSPGLPPLGLDLDDVPEPPPAQPDSRGRR